MPDSLDNPIICKTPAYSASTSNLRFMVVGADASGNAKREVGTFTIDQLTALFPAGATWETLTGKPATFAPSSHTHTSAQISDSSSGGLGEADANKLVKFNIDGTLASAGLATYFSGFPSNNYGQYMAQFRSDQSSYTVSLTADGGVLTNNRNVLWGDRDGYVAITSSPSGVATFVDMRLLTGPFANDEIASNTVEIGQLYYTADGSVKRRMA